MPAGFAVGLLPTVTCAYVCAWTSGEPLRSIGSPESALAVASEHWLWGGASGRAQRHRRLGFSWRG